MLNRIFLSVFTLIVFAILMLTGMELLNEANTLMNIGGIILMICSIYFVIRIILRIFRSSSPSNPKDTYEK